MSFVACRMPSADELALMQQLIGQAKCDVVGRVTPADSNPDNNHVSQTAMKAVCP